MYSANVSHSTMKFKLHPIKTFTLFLTALAVAASVRNFSEWVLLHLASTLGFALILYWFYSFISNKHKNIWNTIATALILFLLIHYPQSYADILAPLLATFFAITHKFFIEYKGSPVLNPSVAALLLTAAIMAILPGVDLPFISWWGASFGPSVQLGMWSLSLSLGISLLWLIFGLRLWVKYPTVFAFIAVHLLVLMFREQGSDFLRYTLTDATVYFLAGAMLIEPKSSPIRPNQQLLFGGFAALTYNLFLQYQVPYAGLFCIGAANLLSLAFSTVASKRQVNSKATQQA